MSINVHKNAWCLELFEDFEPERQQFAEPWIFDAPKLVVKTIISQYLNNFVTEAGYLGHPLVQTDDLVFVSPLHSLIAQ